MANANPQFNLRIDPELKAWLDAKAKETRLSRTWLVNNLIREAKRHDEEKTAA
ncbi:ribbon-helix-helix protein, CopG family [Halomonas sp.]|uniref:ribbon-helix-helix protein, CopG family n=1 Tax=unclassified Halomonas TaxID=2609666 RepID=UPI003F8F3877